MKKQRKHKQVWIKVNTQVDERISNIVALLNEIDGLLTLDSCEGNREWAYIYFRYGNYRAICKLLFCKLAPILIKKYGEDIVFSVEVTNDLEPIGKISFRKEIITELYSLLKKEISSYRKSLYQHDKHDKVSYS